MKKKMLTTLTLVGALAVPVGVVLARDDTTTPVETPTVVEPIREQTRLRLHQEDGCQQCDGTVEMEREQERTRAHVADGTGRAAQDRAAAQAGDCTGDQVRDRDRDRDHAGLEVGGVARGG